MTSYSRSMIPFGTSWMPEFWENTPLEDFLRPSSMLSSTSKHQGLLNMDVVEGVNSFTLFCDVPGVNEGDIDMSYDNDFLTIRVKRPAVVSGTKIRSEREFGSHHRRLRLPIECDKDSAKACLCDGVLKIVFNKTSGTSGDLKRIELT